MYDDITGIILSGGKSKRMGVNKALLKIGNETLIERAGNLMSGLFRKVLLITNTPEEYSFLRLETFEDIYKNVGPLAGIHSGLFHSLTEKNFIIACDMPFINRELIEFIINYKTDKHITIPNAEGSTQQLCGVFSKSILTDIERLIKENLLINNEQEYRKNISFKVQHLFQSISTEIIDIEAKFDKYKKGMFLNVNQKDDFEVAIKRFNE
ncbi:MAG: molybdenum cofactor guanylyltransferase [Ignavibacterium sp.]|jgi:molybdopterin-guanine dinucleotide biosynthesis protein A|nr:molybdenum cofactor guanylyltransferase [Ignavibacterium sp.]